MTVDPTHRPWWADAVIYQIYVRSFQDSDGDGIGDLAGIVARLDHLAWLGVDALWLSPFYPTPLLDGGYDVSDFTDVDPRFGDLAGFDRLVAAAHDRGIRIILDFVPNHTSDQHAWFTESRASRDNPKRDWYVWHDGRDGGPPNNWGSMLFGPAWTQDERTGEWFYHAFLPEQPDLNWRHQDVRAAIADALRFWLARGVDGVRVDAVPHLIEDDLLRDDLPESVDAGGMPVQSGLRHVYTSNRPETLQGVALLRQVIDAFPDRVLIGEAHLPLPLVMRYYGDGTNGLHAPFNFALLETKWHAGALTAAIDEYLRLLPPGAWPNWVLGNHDEPRVATRIGRDQARAAALLAFTLGGAPLMYNGDELGLEDIVVTTTDLASVPEMRHPVHARKYAPHRAPMPWSDEAGHGFTRGRPWLPFGAENAMRNVAAQRGDATSMLALYRRLIELRRREPALAEGTYKPLRGSENLLLFRRETDHAAVLVAINTGDEATAAEFDGAGAILVSSLPDRDGERCTKRIALQPYEGVVVRLDAPV